MRKLLSVLCLLVFASSALGQERTQDPKKQLQSYERYLERKPYHDWAFEKLVAAAVSAGQLEPLVERWRARHAEDPANNGTRVVLVRLMVATDEWDEALELLQAMDAPGAEAHRLEGQLQERRGESDSAAAAFGRAVEATEDPALLESLYGEQAAALLGSGEREAAVAAFRALAQLRPDSFHLRVEAASLLADNGLLEEAAEVLVEAKRLADDDAEKRSRVLSELAKVHERRGDAEQATACYFEAFGLLARGHWLRRELTPRLISLAQRTGGLPALIERCQSDAERRSDLSAREMLAQVLSIAGRQEEARAVLEAAVLDFPADLALSRSLLHMLKLAEDHEARVLEYQRILAAHPRELELYLALGQAFADGGQLDAARREWQRSLERRVDDPSLCTRLAGFFASHEQVDDAIGMYERAIALEPRNLARYGDLALYLTGLERVEEATAALERAVTSAAGDARRLEELSSMWIAQGEPKRAQEALEAALVLEPEAASMMSRLAEIYRRDGEHERAGELLRRVVNVARESSLRKAAVDRLVRSADELGQLQALVDQSQAAIEAGQAGVGDYLLVAKGAERLRRPALAEATLLSLLEQHPDLEEAHLWMARLLRQDGALEEALARYKLLLEIRPQSRRRVLKDMASVHLALYQSAEAFACYEEMLRASPDNPAAWLEVADAYEKLSLSDEALRCVRQAVRLEPESGTTRLRLANTLKQNGEWQRAEAEILTVASQGDPESASLARSKHYSMLREVGEVRRRMEELRVRVLDNPYDVLASLTLSDLYSRESEYALALETVDRLLSYQPREPRLMGERARLLESMERWGEALVVRKELRALPTADPTETSFELARVALELGDMEQARQVLAGVRDARRKAALFRKYKFSELAKTVLREGLGGGQGDASLLLFLARILEADEDYEGAAEALEQVRALRGESWRLAMDIGRLCHLNKDQAGALAAGRQLFELYRTPLEELEKKATSQRLSSGSRSYQSIERWFKEQELEDEYLVAFADEVRFAPRDWGLVNAAMSKLGSADDVGEEYLALVEYVREATADRQPAIYTPESWERLLWSHELRAYGTNHKLGQERAEALTADPATASPQAWSRHAQILRVMERDEEAMEVLLSALVAQPDSPLLLVAASNKAISLDRWADAEEILTALSTRLAVLGEADAVPALSALQVRQQAFNAARAKRQALLQFPRHLRRQVNDALLEELRLQGSTRSWTLSFSSTVRPTPDAIQRTLARCIGEQGRVAEARDMLVKLSKSEDCTLADCSMLASDCLKFEGQAEARVLLRRFFAGYDALQADPLRRYGTGLDRRTGAAGRELAELLESDGDTVGAYEFLRRFGTAGQAALMLAASESQVATIEHFEAQAAAHGGVDRRNALVRLAEVQQSSKQWDAALETYTSIVTEDPGDVLVLKNIAMLHERGQRWPEALETYGAVGVAMRNFNRSLAKGELLEDRLLTPVEPKLPDREDDYSWQSLRSNYYGRRPTGFRGKLRAYQTQPIYAAILKLHLDQGQIGQATEVLRELADEDPTGYRSMASNLSRVLSNYDLDDQGLPLLRVLNRQPNVDERLRVQYALALADAGNLAEAQVELRKLVNDPGVQEYYRNQANERLSSVDRQLGQTDSMSLEDLLLAVEQDSANLQKRLDLVTRLRTAKRADEALEHCRIAADAAPHREDIAQRLFGLLRAEGADEELEQRMRASLAGAKIDQVRMNLGFRLADWALERGDKQGALAVLDEAFNKALRQNYSPAGYWMQRGDREQALAALRVDLGAVQSYYKANVQNAINKLEARNEDLSVVLEELHTQMVAEPLPSVLFEGLVRVADTLEHTVHLQIQSAALIAEAEARGGLLGSLEAAGIEVALGDLEAAEIRLAEAALGDVQNGHLLTPTLVRLARGRDNLQAACAHLDRVLVSGHLAKHSRVHVQGLGSLSEYDMALAEKGLLQTQLGDTEAGLATWASMRDSHGVEFSLIQAGLCLEAELYEQALAAIEDDLLESRGRDPLCLEVQSRAFSKLERWDELLVVLEKLEILEQNESKRRGLRDRMLEVHRERGTLEERLEVLRVAWDADPDDLDLARELAQIYGELGRQAEQFEILEALALNPGLQEKILPVLIAAAKRNGDQSAVLELYPRLLAGKLESWERDRKRKEWIALLVEAGREDEALEALADEHPDPSSIGALVARGELMAKLERFEEALEHARSALELDPQHLSARRLEGTALESLGLKADLLERAVALLKDPERSGSFYQVGFNQAYLKESGRGQELMDIARTSTESADWLVGALVAQSMGEPELSLEWLERCLAADPQDPWILDALKLAYERSSEYDKALAILELLLPVKDRQREGTQASRADWEIRPLRQRRGEYYLLLGKPKLAREAWQDNLGKRYREYQVHPFRHGSFNSNSYYSDGGLAKALEQVELWAEALEARASGLHVDSRSHEVDRDGYRLRVYSGGADEALAELWALTRLKPSQSLQDSQSEVFFSDAAGYKRSRLPGVVLLETARLAGQLQPWVDRIIEHVDPKASLNNRRLVLLALEYGERWTELAAALEAQFAEDDDGVSSELLIALTEAYERAGEMDLALERIAQASLRMAGQSARQDVSFFSSSAYLNRKSKPTRFRFSKQRNSNGGGATHYGGSSSDQRTAAVGATHAGLLRLAGKSAEADAIEAANLKGFEASLWSNSYWSGRLTQRYTELGLYEDAARYAELEHGFRMASLRSDRMRGYSRTSHASFLVKLWRDAGEPERASEALAQLELEYRERLSKAETDKQRAQLLRTQAYFEFGTLHDLERAERSWEEALALDPEQAPANTVRAEWLRVAGKHQAALDELDRLHKSTPWKRVGLPISSRTTLALTEAALGRLDPLLLRSCLIEDPDGQFAEELRAALK